MWGRPGSGSEGDGGVAGGGGGGAGGTAGGGGASSSGHACGGGAAGNDGDGAEDEDNDGCRSVDAAPAAAEAVSVVRLVRAAMWSARRVLGLSLSALDVQNASRCSRRRHVVRIPDSRLRFVMLERPRRVLVDFTSDFVGAAEMSPYVTHYQY